MSDCDQNQIRKSLWSQQLTDLSGKIARPKDPAKKILSATLVIDRRTDSRTFDRNERRDLFQSFGNAVNAPARRAVIEKPVPSAASVRTPERAPRRRDVDVHAHAVAEHGYMRQPHDQLVFRDLAVSVRQVKSVKSRCRISDAL
jgi:hypothetical protein